MIGAAMANTTANVLNAADEASDEADAPVRDQGPAMHWYGWTANMLIGSAVLGILATFLPERLARRIPLSLVWIVSVAAVPVLIYALRFFWRW